MAREHPQLLDPLPLHRLLLHPFPLPRRLPRLPLLHHLRLGVPILPPGFIATRRRHAPADPTDLATVPGLLVGLRHVSQTHAVGVSADAQDDSLRHAVRFATRVRCPANTAGSSGVSNAA